MKTFATLSLLVLPFFTLQAQYAVEPLSMSEGLHEAIVFTVDAVDDRRVERLWNDFIKAYNGKTSRNRRADEYVTDDATIVGITGTVPVDVFFKAEEFGESTRVSTWYRTGEDFILFSENPALEKSAKEFLDEFKLKTRKWRVNEQLEAEEDQLNRLERDLGKLDRLKDRYQDRIEDAKKEIVENEENIKQNEVEQEAMKQNIEKQKEVVEKIREMLNSLKLESE